MSFRNGNRREYRGEEVRLTDLVEDDVVLEGHHFVDCHVIGPAVLVVQGEFTLIDNTIEGDPDAYLWVIPEHRKRVLGAILVKDTTFERCTFTNVGFAGRSDFIERLRSDVETHAAHLA